MIKSIDKPAAARKYSKPHPDFPLTPHRNGQWCKKVRGVIKYFGKIAADLDGQKALAQWLDQKDDLLAGREPRGNVGGFTIADLCNKFLLAKDARVTSREISPRHRYDLGKTTDLIVDAFGKNRIVDDITSDDWERFRQTLAITRGSKTLIGVIIRVRMVFKFGVDSRMIKAPAYGQSFDVPSKQMIRRERADKGEKMFTASEIKGIIAAADSPQLKAMIMLGLNCGLGNSDCGNLRFKHLDLMRGWLNYPRPKTGVARRCPLWPETVEAIQAAVDARPEDRDQSTRDFVFLTRTRQLWFQDLANPISAAFRKILLMLSLSGNGLGFYTLRHVFETIGGGARDQIAVDAIMGHADASMAGHYRERIEDHRLVAVTDHVREWFTGKPATPAKPSERSEMETARYQKQTAAILKRQLADIDRKPASSKKRKTAAA